MSVIGKSETLPLWRSLLYVPANVERFVHKAAGSGADAIILDLEDSVPADAKQAARDALGSAVPLCSGMADVMIRVNGSLRLLAADVEAALAAGADGLLLPKVASAEQVAMVGELCAELRPDRATLIVPLIETTAAVRRMVEIAQASQVTALLVGSEDLAAETMSASDGELLRAIKLQMILAAVEAGVRPLGLLGSIADYRDLETMRGIAEESRRAGMAGATCIHPSAVPVLNAAFSPTEAEFELARRQVEAAEEAARQGRGSCEVDGRMVDAPVVARARRMLAMGKRA